MIRKLLATAALLGAMTGNAHAVNFGNDAVAHVAINGNAQAFCALTPTGAGTTSNVADGGLPGPYGGAGFVFSDGTVSLNIQESTDGTLGTNPTNDEVVGTSNTVKAATATLVFPNSECNYRFTVQAESYNGGLENATPDGAWTGPFTNRIDYNVDVNFGTAVATDVPASAIAGPGFHNLAGATNIVPTIANFSVKIDTVDTNDHLLVGPYFDFLRVQMVPAA